MIGDLPAVEPQNQETFEQRDQFCRWLYWDEYEKPTDAGALARQIHKELFGFHILRNRSSHTWPHQIAKRGWKIDPELLMHVWAEWREAQREQA